MSIANTLNLNNNKWMACKYSVEVELMFKNGKIKKLEDAQIISIYMEKDYDNDRLPILMIDLALSILDKNDINDNTIFHVVIKQFYLEDNDADNEHKSPRIFMDEKLIRLGYGTQPSTLESLEKTTRDSDGVDYDQLATYDLSSKTTYVLVKKDDLTMTKKIINNVIVGATQQEIVCWMLSEVGCPRKVLMSNFSNTKTYDELLLQPREFTKQLEFLEGEFGWFEEGAYIFIDYDIFYIIRKSGTPTAWIKNDITNVCFCISDSTSTDGSNFGIIEQNNTIYVNVNDEGYSMVDAAIVEDQTDGSNMILVNTTTGESTDVKSGTTTLSGVGSYGTKMYHGHNPYEISKFKRMKKENDHIWDITCTNVDLRYFTPQRQFTIISDTTKIAKQLSGIYRISSLQTNIIKNGDTFDNTTTIRIKRTSV